MTFTWKEFKTQVEKLGVHDGDVIDCIAIASTHTSKGINVRRFPGGGVIIYDEHNLTQSTASTPSTQSTKEPA